MLVHYNMMVEIIVVVTFPSFGSGRGYSITTTIVSILLHNQYAAANLLSAFSFTFVIILIHVLIISMRLEVCICCRVESDVVVSL